MRFLKQSNKQAVDTDKEVIVSKSGQKTKRERERARNEISNYFIPARQPLKETGINRGREVSTLPSDAGKSEATSVIRGYHCHPPVSPEKYQSIEKVLYEGFSTRGPSPQKFRLPKPKLGQIFIPRPVTESPNTSNKPTSYCSWSESVRSPIIMGKTMMAEASRGESGLPPTSRQRIPIPEIYKEVGIQAVLDSEVDSPYGLTVRRRDNDYQVAMDKQQKPANASSTHNIQGQKCTESQDKDIIDQLRADRAVLHDCEPHKDFGQHSEASSGKLLESLHTKLPVNLKDDTGRAKHIPEQSTQTGIDADPQAQNCPAPSNQINSDSEVQYIMSRAVLAQRAYINRRSTPKVAVYDNGGASDVRDLAKCESDARSSGAPMENNESLEIDQQRENEASYLLSELVDGRRNEDTSQPGQDRSLGHVSNLPDYEQAQNEDIYGAEYQPNDLNGRGHLAGELDMSHHAENVALPGHTERPQLMIPTRGFSTGAAYIPPVQPRTISPLETMEPIYARQLQNQAFDPQEEQYQLHNPENQGQGAIYLHEGGQWERESHNAGAHPYNPTEMEGAQGNYGDMYDGLDLIDESMYYEEELPFEAEAQMHDAAADEMLFYTQASGANGGYQWAPRQQRYFRATADQSPGIGSWERVRSGAVPRDLTMQFWQPRRGY
jgi:hypothetical protein